MKSVEKQDVESCPENVEETIELYLSGDLPEAQMDAFEDHYFSCDICTSKLAEQQKVMEQIADFANELLPEDVRKTAPGAAAELKIDTSARAPQEGFNYRWLLNAAAAILLFGLTWYLYDPLGPRENDFAPNFVVNESLEQQIALVVRSDADLAILSPVKDAEFDSNPVFNWQTSGQQAPLILTVLDNKARNIIQEQDAKPPYKLSRKLAPGLYYWTLDSPGETLHAGRFYIRK